MSVVGVAGVGEKGACSGRRGFDGVVFCGGAGLGARDAAVSVVLVGVDATGVGEKGAWCTGRAVSTVSASTTASASARRTRRRPGLSFTWHVAEGR